jgi:hypothetical protein
MHDGFLNDLAYFGVIYWRKMFNKAAIILFVFGMDVRNFFLYVLFLICRNKKKQSYFVEG